MPLLSRFLDQRRLFRRYAPWLVLFAGWLWIFAPTLRSHMRRASDPLTFADDMRIQLPHFYHYRDHTLFPNDPIGAYHADGTGELFRWLYIGVGHFVDIVVLAKVLTYLLWLLTAAGVAVAANRLAGKAAAFVAVCMVMGSNVFLDRIIGGLPRAFAYPALAWVAALLVSGRVRTLALLAVLGAGFYPIIPVIAGLALGITLFVLPARDRGSARKWSFKRRAALLAITLVGCGAVMAPFALRMRPYGPVIHTADVAEFPEAGNGGRLIEIDREPLDPFFTVATLAAERAVLGTNRPYVRSLHALFKAASKLKRPLLEGLACVTALGALALGLGRRGRRMRRLATLPLAVFIGFQLAHAVHPSLAPTQRYAYLGVPPLVAILVPSAVLGFLPRRLRLPGRLAAWTAPAWVLGWAGLVLVAMGSHGSVGGGWDTTLSYDERRLFRAFERLPHSAVIAGFPKGTLDNVPLGSKRAAFIGYQMYMPYHQGMTRIMRKRVFAVIDAYYSPRLDALKRLRTEFGVTHFLYEPEHDHGQRLFRPFGNEITSQYAKLKARHEQSALASYEGRALVLRQKGYVLLDLRKL